MRPVPPLLACRAFDTLARHGSVRQAADRLAVSHTVVSRHVKNLEEALGVPLVRRVGRGLSLTSEGERLALQLQRAFDILADAYAEYRTGPGKALHICCGAALASRCLLPRLPELKALLHGRDVLIQPSHNRPTLNRDGVDAEIIYLEAGVTDPDMRSVLVARPRIIAVASPVLLATHKPVDAVRDLLGLPLIHEQSTRQWAEWLARAGLARVPRLVGAQLWHGQMTLEAARLGQGVALVSELIAADALADGSLVETVPTQVWLGGFYLVAPARSWDTAPILAVRKWLAAVFPAPTGA